MVAVLSFFESSGLITLLVILWLSLYVIATLWIFIYKWFVIKGLQDRESYSLDLLLSRDISIPQSAIFARSKGHNILSKEMLNVWKAQILKVASGGLTFLSIVSSTAPFIGLFGTVSEILEAFAHLGSQGQATFEVIAPIISKALVATAWGILCAIPAYSFYLILKRKISVLAVCLQAQIDIAVSTIDNHQANGFQQTKNTFIQETNNNAVWGGKANG
ncbi:MotA/TolQ/ExbB proton channel family protein [Helicobacter didelphidarum]|uniref:MotA/TolQ/ExbB proton channel family protein n=1 Tax=Helicobacter didelphidarum TaxID=2040648 RepID=A0A3D8INP9_9HELI|nr:MotA/TolQ/ExbB proton channel family protein [Helicobacter didelphidarum]RDU66536.1 MotA/TolQ/ExbB proton channel family protein [Helicobacter didelphidarum]